MPVRTPECRCLSCGHKFNSAASAGKKGYPTPGDLTMCLNCGAVMIFADDLTVRAMTHQETDELLADTETLNQLKGAAAIIKLIPTLPTHCEDCGAILMGGATKHKPDCAFQAIIDRHFGGPAS